METIWQDARYALRGFKRKPAFTLIVVVTLALGIGANVAIFSFVNALLLTPLPYKDADRLVRVMSERGGETGKLSMLEVDDFRQQAQLFEGFASIRNTQYNVTGDGPPESLETSVNSYNLFDMLGVKTHIGDTWPASHERQRVFAIVLGYDVWQQRLGGDPKIIGQKIMLDAAPYEVLGVMPPGFNFPLNAQLYRRVPPGDFDSRNIRESGVIAKLKPSVSIAQAQSELDRIARQLEQTYPDTNTGLRLKVSPFLEHYIGEAGGYLWLLLGAVGLVLLIACVNVAGLMLARASTREKEMAVRSALGAGRWRLIRQMLTESLLLTLAGGAVGLLLAVVSVDLMAGMMRFELPAWMKVSVDARALSFTLAVSILTGIAAGLAPALQASKPDLNESLKEGSKGSSGAAGQRARRALVVAEIALALALMAGAGLMVTSFLKLRQTPLGFDPSSTLTMKMDPPWSKYKHVNETAPFYKRVIEEVERIPGVEAAAFNDSLPLAGQDVREGSNKLSVEIEGQPADAQHRNPYVNAQIVSPGYFHALKIGAVAGRLFDERDGQQTTPMAVISRRVAETFWPGQPAQEAVGKRLKLTGRNQNYRLDSTEPDPWLTVAGVVSDVRQRGVMGAPGLDVYVCDQQIFSPESYLAVRAKVGPLTLTQQVKEAVWRADPEQSVFDIQTLEQRVEKTIWQQRLAGIVLLIFAGLALALAAVGIYGVMSFAVSQRTREIGVRMALGAQNGDVLRMVLGEGLKLALIGAGLGLLCALLLARAVSHLFYGVSASDPLTFLGVAVALMIVALLACWFPARRAMRVDPMIALRSE